MVASRHTPDDASSFGANWWSGVTNTGDLAPVAPALSAARTWARAPFDALREHYASAVRAGLIERSQIASAIFERKLVALERATLGPWARRV